MALGRPRYPLNRLLDRHCLYVPRADELNEEQHDVANARGNVRHLLERPPRSRAAARKHALHRLLVVVSFTSSNWSGSLPQSLPLGRSGIPSQCPLPESKSSMKEVRSIIQTTRTVTNFSPGLRQDGRRPYELRSVAMTFSPQANADGSATMQQGLTTVSSTVFGPREPKGQSRSLVHHDKAFISVEVGEAAWAQQGGSKRTRGDKWVAFRPSNVWRGMERS